MNPGGEHTVFLRPQFTHEFPGAKMHQIPRAKNKTPDTAHKNTHKIQGIKIDCVIHLV